MNQKNSNGFTLVELLVVIAIIAILGTIILISLLDARKRANNTKIIAEMHEMKTSAELFYLDNNSYGQSQVFSVATNLFSMSYPDSLFNSSLPNSLAPHIRRIGQLNGNFISGVSTGQAWAFVSWLPYYQEVYCIDSTGTTTRVGIAPNTYENYLSKTVHQGKAYCCVNPQFFCTAADP